MKQNAGFAILLSVAVAAMRLSGGDTAPVRGVVAGPVLPYLPQGPAKAGQAGRNQAGCSAYDANPGGGPGQKEMHPGTAKAMLDTFFRLDPTKETEAQLAGEPGAGIRYAVALVPDPVHTNLSLMFDREMVLVQQAAQDDGYTYDSSWLPWSSDSPKYPLLADQQRAEESARHREACPGVLLFRKSPSETGPEKALDPNPYREALVVFVVGEQPTGGINEDQWANALHWLAQNASTQAQDADTAAGGHTLRILGPSFSGSVVSLHRDLSKVYGGGPRDADSIRLRTVFPKARILSGGVSSCSSIHWFQDRLQEKTFSSAVQFGSFQENDELHIYRFFSYLKDLGTEVRDTAVLSEDETAYADSYHPAGAEEYAADAAKTASDEAPRPTSINACSFPYADANRPLRLSYPRDISALRSAYEKQAVFTTPSKGQGGHAILEEGVESGSEGTAAGDTIKAYAGPMSAVAQEAILYGVVSYLRVHHTRYLLLRCTNPLDFLFLTRFFHRAYPEGRIVTVGSDLLYRREIDTTEFRGVLALSSYPLLPLNQHWSKMTERAGLSPTHVHRVFESDKEGVYLAGRFLFDTLDALAAVELGEPLALPWKENLPDYADPFWLHQPGEPLPPLIKGPTWLTVVGRDGYWPVAVLNASNTPHIRLDEPDQPERPQPPSTQVSLVSTKAHYEVTGNSSPSQTLVLLRFPLSWKIGVGLSVGLLFYQVLGIKLGSRLASSTGLFSVFRHFSSPSQSLLLGVNSAFAAMIFLALLSIGATIPSFGELASESWDFWACLGVALLTIVSIAIVLFYDHRHHAAYAFLAALAVLGGFSVLLLEFSLRSDNTVSLFYRMGHLTGGVSPLLPILFLLTGMYLWTWQAMAGNAMLRCGLPLLPKLVGLNETFGWVEQLRKRFYHQKLTTEESGWNCLSKSKYRISLEMGKRIVNMASPVSLEPEVVFFPLLLCVGLWFCFHHDVPLLSMESRLYALCVNITLLVAFFLTAAEAARLFWTWREFKRLLAELNRMRLRRTFAKLRAVDVNTLWSVSGNLHRVQFLFFSQQLDAVIRLAALPGGDRLSVIDACKYGRLFASTNASRLSNGPRWEDGLPRTGCIDLVNIRTVFADATADVFNTILWPAWREEKTSLSMENSASSEGQERNVFDMPLSEDKTVRVAEEFVCFQYMAFIQNILARMRTMTMSMVFLFLAVCFAISFYPFVPRTEITLWMLANLVLIGSTVLYVYAGMERDETLSYITNTRPGSLSGVFWLKSLGFLAGPLIGLLTTQFPSIAESVLGWLQPGLDAINH